LIEYILEKNRTKHATIWPTRIDLVVLDFDGVMTENTVLVHDDGTEAVVCHRGDGWGIARLQECGVPIIVLSTECNEIVAARCSKLRVPCYHGVNDKAQFLVKFLAKEQISSENVVYLGNDVNDLDAMQIVGFPVSVADGHPTVRNAARLVLLASGGHGAVRELCDMVRGRIQSKVGED
jgi:N-acylneuraminate cytidylyltransferase